MIIFRRNILVIIFIFSCIVAKGQETPLNPVSYKLFNSFLVNPAMVGSKDFSSVNTTVSFQNGSSSQIISGDARLSKKRSEYLFSQKQREFGNIGIGGSVFNDLNGVSNNIGASLSLAYHIPLNKQKLSFLSFGASVKGVKNTLDYGISQDTSIIPSSNETLFPNLDFGVFYYSPRFYAGLSATNLLGNPGIADSLGVYEIPVSQQSFFQTGYKILLSKANSIVLEPSIIIMTRDFSFELGSDDIQALIKLYLKDFCLGMYFNDSSKNSFFFQYRYPGFYIGAYFGIAKNTVYFLNKPLIEISAGINLSRGKFGVKQPIHW